MSELLTPGELADELDMTTDALAQWRHRGEGPLFLKQGRWVRYRRADVQEWLASRVHDRTDRCVGGVAS